MSIEIKYVDIEYYWQNAIRDLKWKATEQYYNKRGHTPTSQGQRIVMWEEELNVSLKHAGHHWWICFETEADLTFFKLRWG